MRNETQKHFHKMLSRQAELNHVAYSDGGNSLSFSVDPGVEETMEKLIQESSDFLARTNSVGVRDVKGRKLRLGSGNSIAGRTDTDVGDRKTTDPTGLSEGFYECAHTDYDTHINYAKLDQWSSHPNFQKLWKKAVIEQIARDQLMIAFNGTSRESTTDRAANPMLEDVNIGWLEKIRQHASGSQHVTDITIGGANEHKNIDALVMSSINDGLEPWYRTDTDLVVISGRNLVTDKYVGLVNDAANQPASERVAVKTLLQTRQLGNTPTIQVPFFPDNGLLIAKLDLLSRYWQKESRRRTIVDNAKRSRIEDYQSVNEDYVVEDFGGVFFVENITEAA